VARSLALVALALLVACAPRAIGSVQSAPVDPASVLGGTVAIELPEYDDIDLAADDHTLATVIRAHGASTLLVTDLATRQTRTITTTPGREVILAAGGAVRGDIVAYAEREDLGGRSIVWHVMVADLRGGTRELDAIPSELGDDPTGRLAPAAITNGHDVVWMRAPILDGRLGNAQIVRWDGEATTLVYRGQARFGIDDDGRIAIARPTGAPDALATWELLLFDGGTAKTIARRAGGGAPSVHGSSIAWPRIAYASSTIDVVDIASGGTRPITQQGCLSVGAAVSVAVFLCAEQRSRVVPLDARTVIDSAGVFLRADPHAIIGRDLKEGRWTVTPVTN
jgi:hypothetical protein